MAINTDRTALLQDKLSKSINFLDYTGLTYEQILTKINQKISADPALDNFRESAIAQTFLEIFAGAIDVVNYYLSRRAEECYMDTAQLKSSVILLSKMLGYVVTRPIPATSNIKMILKGPFASVNIGDVIVIPSQTKFNYNGNPYILTDSFQHTLSADSLGISPSATTYNVEVDVTPTVIQGEIKYKEIVGSTNQQLGQLFQIYKIQDTTFSNLYGSEDIGATGDVFTGTTFTPSDNDLTLIGVGAARDTADYFKIDRKTLLNWETLTSFTSTSAASDICLVRTSPDENVEIIFGDNKYATIGADQTYPNIYIQYFSTIGSKANKIGVIGSKINCNDTIVTDKAINITSNISFQFVSNILNGADLESLESIKYNSPAIYSSLDRCVTSKDYISFLKTLTSPFQVKNAIAWGEQDEINAQGTGIGMYQFMNVVLYSLLGHLYNLTSEPHTWNDVANVVLEPSFSAAGAETQSSYFDLIVNTDPQKRVQDLATSAVSANVKLVNTKLQDRSMVTIKTVYISPIIQDYSVSGTIYLRKLSDIVAVNNKIIDAVYEFADEKADFHVNMYKSNLVEIIENYKEVVYADIDFVPTSTPISIVPWYTKFESLYGVITATGMIYGLVGIIENFCSSASGILFNTYGQLEDFVLQNPNGNPNFTSVVGYPLNSSGRIYTERNFYNALMKKIYDSFFAAGYITTASHPYFTVGGTISSYSFLDLMADIHSNFSKAIKQNMIDSNGNIVFDNSSLYVPLRNEIVRLNVNLNYLYK